MTPERWRRAEELFAEALERPPAERSAFLERECAGDDAQRAFFRQAVHGTEVHTIHAEIEGRSKAALFSAILDDWLVDGVAFVTLAEIAREALARRDQVPVRELSRTRLPGRGGEVTTGWPEARPG